MDLAEGHQAALELLRKKTGCYLFNLGTGKSVSVLELVNEFEKASGKTIKKCAVKRRSGDLPAYFSRPDKAKEQLHWKANRGLDDMCKSTWHFIQLQRNSGSS